MDHVQGHMIIETNLERSFVIVIVIITFTSSVLEGVHRRQIKPVRVFTHSQGKPTRKRVLRDNLGWRTRITLYIYKRYFVAIHPSLFV